MHNYARLQILFKILGVILCGKGFYWGSTQTTLSVPLYMYKLFFVVL